MQNQQNPYFQQPYQMPTYGYQQFPSYPMSEAKAEQKFTQPMYPWLKNETLQAVNSLVTYGIQEGKATSWKHAMTEVASVAYLVGRGMDIRTAYYVVESWEMNEKF